MFLKIIVCFFAISQASTGKNWPFSFGEASEQEKAALNRQISRPKASGKCQSLTRQRKQKLGMKERLQVLMARNQRIAPLLPKEKESLRIKTRIHYLRLKRELRLTKNSLKEMDETMILQGCPLSNPFQ